jgi:pimeloyl-ACP methyl ester carboxylesterase
MSVASHTLELPGLRLSYDVRGSGPVLVITAAPMGKAAFSALAEALADRFTVVTHDPRGVSASVLDDPEQDSTPELRADDLAAILDDLGAESADVFGTSGGAVTGLALVERHPARVRTLIAHEPPLVELLPDPDDPRAQVDAVVEAFRTAGLGAALAKFRAFVDGGDAGSPAQGSPGQGEPSQEDLANATHFVAHELLATVRFVPNTSAISASPARVVVAIGEDSSALLTFRTSTALADRLDETPVRFPGGHVGFLARPGDFADAVAGALDSSLSRHGEG